MVTSLRAHLAVHAASFGMNRTIYILACVERVDDTNWLLYLDAGAKGGDLVNVP